MSYQMQALPGITLHGEPEKTGVYDQQEIVTIITQYYELLAKMRYFPSSYIKYAPHDPPIDVDLAKSYNLEPQVIELLQALPYVEGYSNEDEFILGGSFADMRSPEVLRQSRDPGYCSPDGGFDDEDGEYMRPWELCHITVTGQESGCCEDPGLSGFPERPEGPNHNSHAHLPSRHAKGFFEDCTNRLLKLQWIPSSEGRRMLCEWDEEYGDLKLLFRTYGWPHNFNLSGFDSVYTRWRGFINVKQNAAYCANDVIHAIHYLDRATEDLNSHSRRLRNGIWDRDPGKNPAVIEELNGVLNGRRLEVQRATVMLEKAIAEHGGWDGERAEMVKAWKKHFEDAIEREEKNLEWRKVEGKQFCKQEEVEEMEEKIKVLKEGLMNVDGQPMTAEEAIRAL